MLWIEIVELLLPFPLCHGFLMHSLPLCLRFTFAEWSLCPSAGTRSVSNISLSLLWRWLPHWLKCLWNLWLWLKLGILTGNSLAESFLLSAAIFAFSSCLAHVLEQNEHLVHLLRRHVEFCSGHQVFDAHQLLHQMGFWLGVLWLSDLLHVGSKYLIIKIFKVWFWPVL